MSGINDTRDAMFQERANSADSEPRIEFCPCSGCDSGLTNDGALNDDNEPLAYCNNDPVAACDGSVTCPMLGIEVTQRQASRLYDRWLYLENKVWRVQAKLNDMLAASGTQLIDGPESRRALGRVSA